jgi:hypothetical protein
MNHLRWPRPGVEQRQRLVFDLVHDGVRFRIHLRQFAQRLLVSVEHLQHGCLIRVVPSPARGGGDQALDVELVGVGEKPNQRLLIVRREKRDFQW